VKLLESIFAKVWAGIKYPFTHSTAVIEICQEAFKDGSFLVEDRPQIVALFEGTVSKLEALGPDALAALAGDGVNFVADAKAIADTQAFFVYVKSTLFPGLEQIYNKLKANELASEGTSPAAVPAGVAKEAPATTAANSGVVVHT
jgi:hypothetical protein